MEYEILNGIESPADIKKLDRKSIERLTNEIREFLIDNVGRTGGHLASNLGVIELTLAIHKVFDSPRDHIIFDVGHQSYVHKLVTGRRESFSSLRKPGGLSGFTLMRESSYDSFGAGHSSTSVSASLGFAEADLLLKNQAFTVCVIGDGAYTGGMVHEALNNCRPDLPLVIILNENGMSISVNKGTFASYLSKVRVSRRYRKLKYRTNSILGAIPLVGKGTVKFVSFVKEAVKKLIYKQNYFEELGLFYIGPIDGNDYDKVCAALLRAKSLGKTTVVHVKTVKGKGYAPAEESPDGYHSIGGVSVASSFHSVAAEALSDMAEVDGSIVAITAAMGIGTGLSKFGEKHPDRYFDVGIAEEHALTFSAGLSAAGLSPYVAIYSTFLQRGYDNLLHDIALQKLPVRLLIDRAGLSVGDGATHHGIFDVSFTSHIPNMRILAPIGYDSLRELFELSRDINSPIAIRYPNASENRSALDRLHYLANKGFCRVLSDFFEENAPEYIFLTYGKLYEKVLSAKDILVSEGYSVGVIVLESLKPYRDVAKCIFNTVNSRRIVFAEEGIKSGGAAELLREELLSLGLSSDTDYRIAAIDDNFASPESLCDLYDFVGLSAEKLALKMKEERSFDLRY